MEVFSVESEIVAKDLIEQAVKAVYANDEGFSLNIGGFKASKEQIDGLYTLIKSIKPRDFLEALSAAQIIISHMIAMRKLSQSFPDDQNLGLKFLRLSNDALERLEKKRSGSNQNINVFYNNPQTVVNPKDAICQSVE